MGERRRIVLLILIMAVVAVISSGVALGVLYQTAFEEKRESLTQMAQGQARLIEAVARFDREFSKYDHPEGPAAATISQVVDAHERYKGFGKTGEFTLARRDGDRIVFLLSHRYHELDKPLPVAFDGSNAEPMRRALSGISGTVVGPDYRGVMVLAAYEPVAILNLGIVAKIDLTEIRQPFLRAGGSVAVIALLVIAMGTMLFLRVSNPMIRKIRESEENVRSLLESTIEGIYGIDLNGDATFANRACAGSLGYSDAGDLLGKNMHGLIHHTKPDGSSYPVEECKIFNAYRTGEAVHVDDEVFWRADGASFPVEYWSRPVTKDGETVGAVVSFVDITERIQAAKTLALRAGELARSNAELEEFAYVASHDLQEPLRKIQAFADRLRTTLNGNLSEKGEDFLARMESATARMRDLIDHLLNYSRISRGPRSLAAVDIGEVVDGVISNLEARIEKTGGRVDVDAMPTIEADPLQMEQLFQNLIDNGLKFHRHDQAPVVLLTSRSVSRSNSFHSASRDGKAFCEISVADNGIGFQEKHSGRIFEVFQRLHGRGEFEGAGIGLSICRKIVERHGGGITATGRPDEGATFVITLPLEQRQEGESE